MNLTKGCADQSEIAAAIIPVAAKLFRKVGTKKQFLYTQLQDHQVWSSYDFWLDHFFVENQIRLVRHYRPALAEKQLNRYSNVTILRATGEQLADWQSKTENQKKTISEEEEGIVFNQITELVSQLIPLLVPFNPSKIGQLYRHMRANKASPDGASSVLTSNVSDDEEDEGFSDSDQSLKVVEKFVEKIQDKLCIECKIQEKAEKALFVSF